VGNIDTQVVAYAYGTVHPHVCGEHCSLVGAAYNTRGSSPRVWGTFSIRIAYLRIGRFIPTCVGNITDLPCNGRRKPVHPHVCGEHAYRRISWELICGSSPRVWGTSPLCGSRIIGSRFIPTCVGNMFWFISFTMTARFIPTCVGNILSFYYRRDVAAVHPHVCGEHMKQSILLPP